MSWPTGTRGSGTANAGYGLAKLKTDRHAAADPDLCPLPLAPQRARIRTFGPATTSTTISITNCWPEAPIIADGQILDEDYVFGSFIQSKMYHKDIRCTDCHNPHTARLKHEGNKVCTSCHQHAAAKYDTPATISTSPIRPVRSCVECHMPETTYMEVDPRRDHSIRIPRPDLSVAIWDSQRLHALSPERRQDFGRKAEPAETVQRLDPRGTRRRRGDCGRIGADRQVDARVDAEVV